MLRGTYHWRACIKHGSLLGRPVLRANAPMPCTNDAQKANETRSGLTRCFSRGAVLGATTSEPRSSHLSRLVESSVAPISFSLAHLPLLHQYSRSVPLIGHPTSDRLPRRAACACCARELSDTLSASEKRADAHREQQWLISTMIFSILPEAPLGMRAPSAIAGSGLSRHPQERSRGKPRARRGSGARGMVIRRRRARRK